MKVRVQLARLVREVADVEIEVPEGATEETILEAARNFWDDQSDHLSWEPDHTWGVEYGTPSIYSKKE